MTLRYTSYEDMYLPFDIEEAKKKSRAARTGKSKGKNKSGRKKSADAKTAKQLDKVADSGEGEVKIKGAAIDGNAAAELKQAVQDRQDRGSGEKASTLDVLAQARKSAQVGKRAAKKGEGGVSVSMNNEVMTTTAATRATPGSKARVRITGATSRGEEKPKPKPKTDTKPYQRRGGWGREPAEDTPTSNALDTAVAGGMKAAGKFVGKVVRGATTAIKNRADAEKAAGQKSAAAADLRSKIRGASGEERADLQAQLTTLKSSGKKGNLTSEQRSAIRTVGKTKGDTSSAKPDAGMQKATGIKVGVIKRGDSAVRPRETRDARGPVFPTHSVSAGAGGADTKIGASSKVPTRTEKPAPKTDAPKTDAPKTDAPKTAQAVLSTAATAAAKASLDRKSDASKSDASKPKTNTDAPKTDASKPKPKPNTDASSDGASQPGMTAATGVRPKKKSPQELAQKRALSQATGIKAESLRAMLKAICQQKRKMSPGCASLIGGGLNDTQRQILAAISKRKPAKFKGDKPKTANIAPGNATAPANLPKSFVGKSGQHRPGKNNDGTEAREQRKKDESLDRIIVSRIAKLMN